MIVNDFKKRFIKLTKVQKEESISKMVKGYEKEKKILTDKQLDAFVMLTNWCKENVNGRNE